MTKKAGSGSISKRHEPADPDPYPYQNVTDPQHSFSEFQCFFLKIPVRNFWVHRTDKEIFVLRVLIQILHFNDRRIKRVDDILWQMAFLKRRFILSPLFWIRDILVPIWLHKMQTKKMFLSFLAYNVLFEGTLTSFFTDKKS